MIKTEAPIFGRVLTAMVTPFGDDLELDLPAVEKLVNYLIATGTDSIVVSGTTGESPTLKDEEKIALLKAVITASAGRAKVIMGTGYNSTVKAVDATIQAESIGADGVLVVCPYYNKPSQEGLIAHFQAVASSTKLPVIIYNIPARTGVNMTAETTIALANRCPNIHALKDSTGSLDQSADLAGQIREDFRVYCGDDYLTLPFLSIGACGIVSVASHLVGRQIKSMIDAFFANDLDKAREIHYKYLPLFKGLFAAPNPTCVKFALSTLGICKSNLRLPLVPLNPQQQETLTKLIEKVGIGVSVPVA